MSGLTPIAKEGMFGGAGGCWRCS